MSAGVKRFIRHYVEMVVVMLVGMSVLALPIELTFNPDRTAAELITMGFTMTVPMVPWMRWRGHSWQPTIEMAAAMIVPTLAALALLGGELVTDAGALMGIEHTAMFAGMFAVMLARYDEYAHHGHHVRNEVAA
jgi:hypothetical protein